MAREVGFTGDEGRMTEEVLRAYPHVILQFRVENPESQLDKLRPSGQLIDAASEEPIAVSPRHARDGIKQFVIANVALKGSRIMTSLVLAREAEADLPLELVESVLVNFWSAHFDEFIGWREAIEQFVDEIPDSCIGRFTAYWNEMKVSTPVFALDIDWRGGLVRSDAHITFFLSRYVTDGSSRVPFLGSKDEKYQALRTIVYSKLGIPLDHDIAGCHFCRCEHP